MLSAGEIAAAVRSGEASAEEITREHLARIEEHRDLNAFVTVDAEGAIAAARCVDTALPLAGVPLVVKDLFDVAGLPATYGSPLFRDHMPTTTASSVQRLVNAGCVILGKANLHEFAWGVVSRNRTYGFVVNPRLRDRIAGGSSGGNAAALAVGIGALGLGTDTGGSIRIPAAACGVAGYKTSVGLVPTDGVWPLTPSCDTVGPMARSMADCALMLSVLAELPVPAPHLDGLRIGDASLIPDIGDLLRLQYSEIADVHRDLFAANPDAYDPELRWKMANALSVDASELPGLQSELVAWKARCEREIDVDVIVSPTIPGDLPLATDELTPALNERLTRHTRPFNLLGWPSATCVDGTMISGREDALVLGAALAWEQNLHRQ